MQPKASFVTTVRPPQKDEARLKKAPFMLNDFWKHWNQARNSGTRTIPKYPTWSKLKVQLWKACLWVASNPWVWDIFAPCLPYVLCWPILDGWYLLFRFPFSDFLTNDGRQQLQGQEVVDGSVLSSQDWSSLRNGNLPCGSDAGNFVSTSWKMYLAQELHSKITQPYLSVFELLLELGSMLWRRCLSRSALKAKTPSLASRYWRNGLSVKCTTCKLLWLMADE